MKRLVIRAGVIAVALTLLAGLTSVASASTSPKLRLSTTSRSGKVGTSLKVSVTVDSSRPAYEIWIYGKTGSAWHKVATATLVSSGHYTAYVKLTRHGKLMLRAAFVDKSRHVQAYSNTVTVTVT
jgi:hypothetical protein